MSNTIEQTQKWYEKSYTQEGFGAQRLYPNEEFLRFMGRNYFVMPRNERKKVKILEIGCGSCSNLWMVAREGFSAYGIDLSAVSLDLGKQMLHHWQTKAQLEICSMTQMPYANSSFSAICDIFSSYCLNMQEFEVSLDEVTRLLEKNGKYFTYIPSDGSMAFKNHFPAVKLDEYTLNGIYREDSPFYGNFYSYRFTNKDLLVKSLEKRGFKIENLELITKTYNSMKEVFEWISLEATKIE